MLPKDYVRLRLTGEWATDVADASGTLLLDVARRTWSAEVLDALETPARLAAAGARVARGLGLTIAVTDWHKESRSPRVRATAPPPRSGSASTAPGRCRS